MDNITILAQEGSGFATTVTGAVSGMGGELATVGGAAIAIGVVVFGLRKGWSTLKSLV